MSAIRYIFYKLLSMLHIYLVRLIKNISTQMEIKIMKSSLNTALVFIKII